MTAPLVGMPLGAATSDYIELQTQGRPLGGAIVDDVLALAGLGWRVFPVMLCGEKGKKPLILAWQKAASTDPEQIRRWWIQFPDAAIGVLTGRAGGLLVIDIDVPDGEESLQALEIEVRQRLVATVSQVTPRGGRHLFFRYPEGCRISRRTPLAEDLRNLDLLADESFVVVAPSRREDGSLYEWEATSS
ncbi:bifunctional DNA primase/polymerase, partial [Candidatus Fermentibacterales bacterium]|nr:bifunctional DNA primase/polymerase [Candidatus Fermentibacterales bacterium]